MTVAADRDVALTPKARSIAQAVEHGLERRRKRIAARFREKLTRDRFEVALELPEIKAILDAHVTEYAKSAQPRLWPDDFFQEARLELEGVCKKLDPQDDAERFQSYLRKALRTRFLDLVRYQHRKKRDLRREESWDVLAEADSHPATADWSPSADLEAIVGGREVELELYRRVQRRPGVQLKRVMHAILGGLSWTGDRSTYSRGRDLLCQMAEEIVDERSDHLSTEHTTWPAGRPGAVARADTEMRPWQAVPPAAPKRAHRVADQSRRKPASVRPIGRKPNRQDRHKAPRGK